MFVLKIDRNLSLFLEVGTVKNFEAFLRTCFQYNIILLWNCNINLNESFFYSVIRIFLLAAKAKITAEISKNKRCGSIPSWERENIYIYIQNKINDISTNKSGRKYSIKINYKTCFSSVAFVLIFFFLFLFFKSFFQNIFIHKATLRDLEMMVEIMFVYNAFVDKELSQTNA